MEKLKGLSRIKGVIFSLVPPLFHPPMIRSFKYLKSVRSRLTDPGELDAATLQALNHLEWLLLKWNQPLKLRIYSPNPAREARLAPKLARLNERLARYGTELKLVPLTGSVPQKPHGNEVQLHPPRRAAGIWRVASTDALINVLRSLVLASLTKGESRAEESEQPGSELVTDFELNGRVVRVPRKFSDRPAFSAYNSFWREWAPTIRHRLPGADRFLNFHQPLYRGSRLIPPERAASRPEPAAIQDPASVKIVVPFRDHLELLPPLIRSVAGGLDPVLTPRLRIGVVLVDNGSKDTKRLGELLPELRLEHSERIGIHSIREDIVFNHSRLSNAGAAEGDPADYLLFLNNDCLFITPGWLSRLVARIHGDPAIIGASGALHYPAGGASPQAGAVQSMGIQAWAEGAAKNAFRKQEVPPGYLPYACFCFPASAVTGAALLIRTELFHSVDGFNELRLPTSYNDVDLCLRAIEKSGGVFLVDPAIKALHIEGRSRGQGSDEFDVFQLYQQRGLLFRDSHFLDPYLALDDERP